MQIGRNVTVYHVSLMNVSLMNAIVFFYDNLDIFVMEVQYAVVISIQINKHHHHRRRHFK